MSSLSSYLGREKVASDLGLGGGSAVCLACPPPTWDM